MFGILIYQYNEPYFWCKNGYLRHKDDPDPDSITIRKRYKKKSNAIRVAKSFGFDTDIVDLETGAIVQRLRPELKTIFFRRWKGELMVIFPEITGEDDTTCLTELLNSFRIKAVDRITRSVLAGLFRIEPR